MAQSSLLKFQLGPVQDFIAAARSTRDLWSGSYLLSFLMAAGIRKLRAAGGELIFPSPEGQLLLEDPASWPGQDSAELLTPNLPNVFVARISGDPKSVAMAVESAIRKEWEQIANAVWEKRGEFGLGDQQKNRFPAQIGRHLSIAWQTTPDQANYRDTYERNGWLLDATRQTRDFKAWDSAGKEFEKDSLNGAVEALIGGTDFQGSMERRGGEYPSLFAKHSDHFGAVAIIKRVWHLAYLRDAKDGPQLRKFQTIRSTRGIAARDFSENANDDTDLGEGEKYLAAIAFDGDSIGKWISGEKLPPDAELEKHHKDFSTGLSNFAMKRARDVVEEKFKGFLIYAGGDDVVALVPADLGLACAKELRTEFQQATDTIKGKDGDKPDASAGIAIAHIKSPLQDLIRAAQQAEKDAKTLQDRSAFSITLMKRSGEISKWGAKWDSGAIELHETILNAMRQDGKLSAKFPHRVCQLLEPYRTIRTGLFSQTATITDPRQASDLITREFLFAAERQGSKEMIEPLTRLLETYLQNLPSDSRDKPPVFQQMLDALVGLCTAAAFSHRNQPKTADRQTASV